MFCTKCGVELNDKATFCSDCGMATGRAGPSFTPRVDQMSRPMHEAKLGGVCAGFARYFGMDVTLVRILWLVITLIPLPCFGLVAYIVCWIVMPKDPVPVGATMRAA